MKRLIQIAIVIGLLTIQGCVTTPTEEQRIGAYYGVYPEQYEKIVTDYFMTTLIDPESARFQFEGQPDKGWLPTFTNPEASNPFMKNEFGWVGRVSVNAKNRMGGYVGYTLHAYLIRDGGIVVCKEL